MKSDGLYDGKSVNHTTEGVKSGTARDIRELRSLLQAFTLAKRTAWQTIIRLVTTGFIFALIAGAAIKLKIFDGP